PIVSGAENHDIVFTPVHTLACERLNGLSVLISIIVVDLRAKGFAGEMAASTVCCFEALVATHHFCSYAAHRGAGFADRLELETKTFAARRALFFPSR